MAAFSSFGQMYSDNYESDSGSGSSLDSILNAVDSLSNTAGRLYESTLYSPQNSGIAVNQGRLIPATGTTVGSSLLAPILLVGAVFIGIFAWKKL